MSCPASIDQVVYCTRIDGHTGPHVAAMGLDYLALGIVSDVWTEAPSFERFLPHEPEHGAAVRAHLEERSAHPLEDIR